MKNPSAKIDGQINAVRNFFPGKILFFEEFLHDAFGFST